MVEVAKVANPSLLESQPFPLSEAAPAELTVYPFSQITLRDIFAGFAAAGLVTNGSFEAKDVATKSYQVADALLGARGG